MSAEAIASEVFRAGLAFFQRKRPPPTEPRIDPTEFARIVAELEAEEFDVYMGPTETAELERKGAEASYMPTAGEPGYFKFRESPSRGAVAEELYHSWQHRRAGWHIRDDLEIIRLEIEAQLHLIEHARRQGWTKREIKRFRQALRFWTDRLRQRVGS